MSDSSKPMFEPNYPVLCFCERMCKVLQITWQLWRSSERCDSSRSSNLIYGAISLKGAIPEAERTAVSTELLVSLLKLYKYAKYDCDSCDEDSSAFGIALKLLLNNCRRVKVFPPGQFDSLNKIPVLVFSC